MSYEDEKAMERIALLEERLNILEGEVKKKNTESNNNSHNETLPIKEPTESISSVGTSASSEVYESSEIPISNSIESRPRSFRWSNSIVTRRVNADDDYKVNNNRSLILRTVPVPVLVPGKR